MTTPSDRPSSRGSRRRQSRRAQRAAERAAQSVTTDRRASQTVAKAANQPPERIARIDSEHLLRQPAAPRPQTRADRAHRQIDSTLGSAKRVMNVIWGWPLFWMSALVGVGFTGVGALAWLFTMPPLPDCTRPELLTSDRERLHCAQEQAESGELRDIEKAIDLVASWTDERDLAREGQILLERWSNDIVNIATRAADAGKLERAIDLLGRVPRDSAGYAEAQELKLRWEQSWREGSATFDRVVAALSGEDWYEAEYQAEQLAFMSDFYWYEVRYKDATTRIAAEKEGRRKLKQAKSLVEGSNSPKDVYAALESIGQIERGTFAREASQPQIDEWSKKLLNWAIERKREGRIDEALAAAEIVPQEADTYSRARDLVALAQSELAIAPDFSPLSIPLGEQIALISDAQAVAAKMSPKHPLYRSTQALLLPWELYLEDLLQLQIATGIASFGQPLAFRTAIAQAREISLDRPGRLLAQTLISGWQRELERIEDKPLIERARALARLNTIDGYKAAIDQAEKLPRDRGSWVDAEALIAWCRGQIETIEDQPILDRARQLIADGKVEDAVALLKQIGSGRALYADARQLIGELGQRELLERDGPILERARTLAEAGKLTEAIRVAENIPKDSPLYRETQTLLTEWVSDRGERRDNIAPRGANPDDREVDRAAPSSVEASDEASDEALDAAPVVEFENTAPEPVYSPEPEPVWQPEPEPVYSPEPEPVWQAEPEPVWQPKPEPVYSPEPEPIYSPEPVYDAEPVDEAPDPKLIPEPAPEAIVEPAPEASPQPAPILEPPAADIAPPPALPDVAPPADATVAPSE